MIPIYQFCFNIRPTEINAAIGLSQLKNSENFKK